MVLRATDKIRSALIWIVAILGLISIQSNAQTVPASINISGGLFNSNGTAVTSSNVGFKLEVLDQAGACVLYSEEHLAQNLSQSKGAFSVQLGLGTSPLNFLPGTTGFDRKLFVNSGVVPAFGLCATGVTLASGDGRLIRVSYNLGGGFVTMTPDVPIVSAAYAMVADTVQGKGLTDLVQTNTSSAALSQANIEVIFSNVNFTKLTDLLNGTSTQYLPTAPTAPVNLNGQRIVNILDPTGAQDAATKNYADNNLGGKTIDSTGIGLGVGGGKTLVWDQALNKWVAQTPASYVGGVVAGSGLLGGTITSFGTLSVDVGTNANQIVQLTNLSYLPAVDGHLLTNIQFPVLSVAGRTGVVTLNASDISGLGTAAVKDYGTASGNLVELAGASLLPALNGSLLTNVNATLLQTRAVANVAPAGGQILTWNSSASQWEPQNATIAGITDLTGDVTASGPGSAVATISANAVTSGKINNTGNVINRLLITDGATGATVTYATCLQGEVMKFDVTTGWGCAPEAGSTGFVTVVAAGTGLVANTITSTGTLNVDVGTTANKILQLNGSAQIPAVDGGIIANINAVRLQGRDLASAAPISGQVIGWTGSRWEPISVTSGTLTQIIASTGLLGGTINSNGTLSVDVGVAANQIVQLTAGAQYPAVDGNLISNVNAVKIQGRDVAATAPGASQVLGWNGSTSQWEPLSAATGSVTNVISGTGLVAGNISSFGTINVDVGVTANKILQLDSNAQIPAVDGFLVTNINAAKLQNRNLASTAPAAGQVIGWTGTQWEPISVTSGTLTQIVASTGLLGGTINSNGTLSVDVGVAANQIVQLTAGAQYPAVDGNLISNVNAVKIQGRDIAATAPSSSQVLGWNGSTSQWEPISAAVGSVTNVISGTGLVAGNISSLGTINVDVGITANKILQLDSNAQIPAVDGFLVTNVNAVKLQNRNLASTAPAAGQVIGWTGTQWEPISVTSGTLTQIVASTGLLGGTINSNGTVSVDVGVTANKIVQLDSNAQYPAVDGNLITNVNAVKLQARSVAATAPGDGQVLTWNNGTSVWEPKAPGAGADNLGNHIASQDLAMTNFSITGLNIGSAGAPSLSFNSDVTTGVYSPGASIVAVATAGAERLRISSNGMRLAPAALPGAPAAGDIAIDSGAANTLKYYNGSAWVSSSGTMTGVVSGAGLVAGTVTSYGTLNVDVGVTANKIVQLDSNAQIPAVDGFFVTNINAVKLQNRNLASNAPTSGQVIGWTGSQWEPISVTSGTLTQIIASTGLLGGTINSNGTVSVDVGVTGNKIVQLTAGAQYPAVDGNLISNVNAVKIQGRDVAATAPASSQVLGWNGSTSQWEPLSAATGSVTNVISGTGLVAGNISSFGTINVDVGVTANKILQLDSNAQIPAVDGFLVTNINAVKLQNRNLASNAPASGQVIGWTGSQWEPISVTSGTLTQIIASTGLLGGTINSNGTLSVDVGVAANQIVQLTAGAQYPAVDGSLISNVNAVKLQTRSVAATAPGDGQVLTWNNGTSVWEPKAPGAGADNLGNHVASQDLAMSNFSVLGLNLGTAGAPSLSFNSDATTGVYSPGASIVAVATAGTERLRVTSNGMRLAPAALPGAPAAGDIAIDSGAANTLKYYNGSAWVSSSGTLTGVVSGAGLVAGTITSYGTLNVDVGVTGNKILQLTAGAQYPAVDGNLISNVNAVKIQGRDIASTAPSASQVLGWNAGTSQWEPLSASAGSVTNVISGVGLVAGNISSYGTINVDVGVTANKVLQLDSNAQIPAVDGFLVTNINAIKLQNRDLASNAPTSGQVIGWTGSQWEPISVTSGTLTQIVASTGLLGGTINSNGTVSVDVGVTANKIVQLTAGAQYPAVDGNLISNVNAVKIQGRDIASTVPSASQVLGWNGTTSQWEPLSAATGSVTNVISGAGLVAGNINSFGTINVDVGVTANKVLQLDSNAQIPAVDGFLVTNINAVKLQNRDLASTAPTSGQVIGWTGSQWEPISITSGTLTQITASTGLLGGTINSNGTLSVDVGTTANKIVQLTAGAQYPAVDGFLITNVNSVKLQSRNVANTVPTANQVLTWNNASAQWEPQAVQASSNAFVQNGNALGATAILGTTDVTNLNVITNGLTRMTVTSAGAVGVGTTAPIPGAILDVNGTGTIGSAMVVPRDTTALRPTAGTNGMIRYNTSTSKFEAFENNAWTNMVGGGAPSFPLLASPVGTAGAPAYSFSGDATTGMYDVGVGTLGFATGGTARMVIDSNGNLGIGTTTPSSTLSFDGLAPRTIAMDVNSAASTGNSLTIQAGGSGAGTDLLGGNLILSGGSSTGSMGSKIVFQVAKDFQGSGATVRAPATVMTMGYSGLGIGVASPTHALDATINGNAPIALFSNSYSAARGAELILFHNRGGGALQIGDSVGEYQSQGTNSVAGSVTYSNIKTTVLSPTSTSESAKLSLQTLDGGTLADRITIAGSNVGIGTSTPAPGAILDVNGTGTIGSAMVVPRGTTALRPTAGVNGMIRYNTSTSKMEFFQSGAWANATPQAFSDLVGGYVDDVGFNLAITPDRASNFNASNQNNVAFGYGALKANTGNSDGNTAIGMNSLTAVVPTGSGNTGLGMQSGPAITTGDFNIAIGYNSGATITTEDSNIVIGRNADIPAAGTSSFLNIGDVLFSNMTVKTVGVGTNSPKAALDVYGIGTIRSALIIPRDTTANRPTSAVNGMIRYNSSTSRLEGFENGQWGNISAATAGANSQWTTAGTDIYYNTGNVGIGTNTPAAKIHGVTSLTGATGDEVAFRLDYTTNKATSGNDTGLQLNMTDTLSPGTSYPLDVRVNGSSKFNVDNAGSISALQVNATGGLTTGGTVNNVYAPSGTGTGPYQGANTASSLYLNNWSGTDAAGAFSQYFVKNSNNVAQNAYMGVISTTGATVYSPSLVFGHQSGANTWNERMRIDSNGNVGIGTTTPAPGAILDLNGTGTIGSAMVVPRGSTALRPAGGTNGMIRYNTSTSRLEGFENGQWGNISAATADIAASGSAGAIQYSDGAGGFLANNNIIMDGTNARVGIGTTSTPQGLSVYANPYTNGALESVMEIYTTSASGANSGAGITFGGKYTGGGSYSNFAGIRGRKANASSGNSAGVMTFMTKLSGATLTEQMRIDENGSVGIGTTTVTPGAILDISGTGTIGSAMVVPRDTTALRPAAGTNGMIRYNSATNRLEGFENGQWGNISAATSGTASQWTASGNDIYYNTGNVGIGTSTPGSILEVRRSTAGAITTVKVENTDTGAGSGAEHLAMGGSTYVTNQAFGTGYAYTISNAPNGYAVGTYAAAPLKIYTNSVERMRVDQLGNVGIGTTSPVTKLDVNGQIKGGFLSHSSLNTNWNSGNIQLTSVAAGTLTFTSGSAYDGASYVLILTSTGTFTLSTTGDITSWKCLPACTSNQITGTGHTVLTIIKAGTVGYLSWGAGYQ